MAAVTEAAAEAAIAEASAADAAAAEAADAAYKLEMVAAEERNREQEAEAHEARVAAEADEEAAAEVRPFINDVTMVYEHTL